VYPNSWISGMPTANTPWKRVTMASIPASSVVAISADPALPDAAWPILGPT
jgi:hypothetical protein